MKKLFFVFLLAFLMTHVCVQADPLYVDGQNGSDAFDGSSWTDQGGSVGPKKTLLGAIISAVNGDIITVADGTYSGLGNRDIGFDGKAITLQSQNGPDNCIIDCQASQSDQHRAFILTDGEDQSTIIDGFSIINGYANAGGAVKCVASGPTIKNCILTQNFAGSDGPFENGGGGFYCSGLCDPVLINCIITDNTSANWAGGVYAEGNCTLTLINCLIAGNWAENYGGGIYGSDAAELTITNCTIVENSTAYLGGGIRLRSNSVATVTNTIVWNNVIRDDQWDNGPEEIALDETASLDLAYCDIKDGYIYANDAFLFPLSDYGDNNYSFDPCFVEPGLWDDNSTPTNPQDDLWTAGDYQLQSLSTCRNLGNDTAVTAVNTDIAGNDRIIGLAVDLGAYEMTVPDGPDLSGLFDDVSFYDPFVPGDKANALFDLINSGNQTAEGTIGLNFYLSENTVWDDNDIALGQVNNVRLRRFNAGNSKIIRGRLVVPNSIASGSYYLMAVIDPDNTLLEADESIPSNVILQENPINLAWKFGEVDGRKNVKLTVLDHNDVPVTFTLRGGWGEVIGDEQFTEIRLYNTTDRSAFAIKTKGRGVYTSVGDIIAVDGSLNSISAKTTDLLGDITIEGILKKLDLHDVIADSPQAHTIEIKGSPASTRDAVSITFSRVTDLSVIAADLPIKAITCTEWLKSDGIDNTIETPWLAKLTTKGNQRSNPTSDGNFEADLLLTGENAPRDTALNTVKIAGAINNAVWDITGNVGSITSGALQKSVILIGVVADLPALTGQPTDFASQNTLKSLTLKGFDNISFTDSQLAAWEITKLTFPKDATADGYIQYAELSKHNTPAGVTLIPVQ